MRAVDRPHGAGDPDGRCSLQMTGARQRKIIDSLHRLISFQSVSENSNRQIIEYIEEELGSLGYALRRFPAPSGDKASLLASTGPVDRHGVLLSAHTDVVPVEGQTWSTPPFAATTVDGRVVGRGASDMKGFIAVCLANAAGLHDAARDIPVHLAFSYDEEIGCRGVSDLVDAVARMPARPLLCIVGEPTRMKVAVAHKGKLAYRVTVRGKGGHSAMPHRAANAIEFAADIVMALRGLEKSLCAVRRAEFEPPFATVHVGSLHGGTALNLVPDRATLEFEVRFLPGADMSAVAEAVERSLRTVRDGAKACAPEADIILEEIAAYPPLDTDPASGAVKLAGMLAGDPEPGIGLSFGTEGGFYAKAGIPTIVCGPGDIARAHKADEWIAIDELMAADAMMERLSALIAGTETEFG
jgi:acetylornithine deacetylase